MSGRLTTMARWLRSTLVSPEVVGAIYMVSLAVWAGRPTSGADVGDLRRGEVLETFVSRRFVSESVRIEIGILGAAVALGLVIGLVAALLLRVRHPSARLERRSIPRALVESVLLVSGIHAALVMWSMADSPQLYSSRWYAEGGLLRTVQVFATDSLGPGGVVGMAIALALIYVGPSRFLDIARRARMVVRDPARIAAELAARSTMFIVGVVALSSDDASVFDGSRSAADGAGAKSEPPPSPSGTRPPNVVILAVDSLRADRLEERHLPNLSRLASRGTRFDRAYVSLPSTFPSWVTILTGRHGHHHGVRSMFPTWEERAKDFDALPMRFARAGYVTGVVSDDAGDFFGRIDLGFGLVETPSSDLRERVRQRVLERETPLLPVLHSHLGRKVFPVMRELADAADPRLLADDVEATIRSTKDKPFFLTVFFGTARSPYAAPAPYYAKYTERAYRGRFKYEKPIGLGSVDEPPLEADDVRQIRALYDGAVSAVDDAAGRILRALDDLALADRTIVIVTADHGEMLFENGRGQGHGDHLFGDEVTHVPLVIYDPRMGGRREMAIARDVDLAPTLYELAGVAAPSDLDGRSLVPALRGERLVPRMAYAESELWFTEEVPAVPAELRMPYPGLLELIEPDPRHDGELVLRKEMTAPTLMARHRMVRGDRYKLVYVPTRERVRYMLFDTQEDPGETKDLAEVLPEEVRRLKAELWSWMLEDPRMERRDGYLVPRDAPARGSP